MVIKHMLFSINASIVKYQFAAEKPKKLRVMSRSKAYALFEMQSEGSSQESQANNNLSSTQRGFACANQTQENPKTMKPAQKDI